MAKKFLNKKKITKQRKTSIKKIENNNKQQEKHQRKSNQNTITPLTFYLSCMECESLQLFPWQETPVGNFAMLLSTDFV